MSMALIAIKPGQKLHTPDKLVDFAIVHFIIYHFGLFYYGVSDLYAAGFYHFQESLDPGLDLA